MCAAVCSSLLIFTLAIISIFSGTKMATVGLPLVRQENGPDPGILAGEDFLSVFMGSSYRHARHEIETTSTPSTTTTTEEEPPTTFSPTETTLPSSSSTTTTTTTSSPTTTESSVQNQYARDTRSTSLFEQNLPKDSNGNVVLSVHVSSSIGTPRIAAPPPNHHQHHQNHHPPPPAPSLDEEPPNIIAASKQSEFSVEESEPITTNRDLIDDGQGYPASVQQLPTREFQTQKSGIHPLQHTVIYHGTDNGNGQNGNNRARSVSYSTVIQAIPNAAEKRWVGPRRERHYDTSHYSNNELDLTSKLNNSRPTPPPVLPTAAPWSQGPSTSTSLPSVTERNSWRYGITTERDWERPFAPPVYGVPEQNYEVDESASVMSNGRIHGVQPVPTSSSQYKTSSNDQQDKKVDDNQKVGYVVEGRNYRKYRVEERTSDGFIVGEYGVVSHDDGSLRGVRYTADGTISPRLIYDALMKFLSL